MTWKQWLEHPERVWIRGLMFQIHLLTGAMLSGYLFLMSLSGSLIVHRYELERVGFPVDRVVSFHANLLAGETGRFVNGIGALCLTLLCLTGAVIWWPGLAYWRRGLTVQWGTTLARINWDVHSAVGIWFLVLLLMWGLSGTYLAFPDQFAALFRLNPGSAALAGLAELHFGRFGSITKTIWTLAGLIPAILAFTGMFVCCRRVMLKKPTNPWMPR